MRSRRPGFEGCAELGVFIPSYQEGGLTQVRMSLSPSVTVVQDMQGEPLFRPEVSR
jgi:hypothetical protein